MYICVCVNLLLNCQEDMNAQCQICKLWLVFFFPDFMNLDTDIFNDFSLQIKYNSWTIKLQLVQLNPNLTFQITPLSSPSRELRSNSPSTSQHSPILFALQRSFSSPLAQLDTQLLFGAQNVIVFAKNLAKSIVSNLSFRN